MSLNIKHQERISEPVHLHTLANMSYRGFASGGKNPQDSIFTAQCWLTSKGKHLSWHVLSVESGFFA